MSEKIREEFEAWLPWMGSLSTRRWEKWTDHYEERDVQVMWEAWKASRESLVVEFPPMEQEHIDWYDGSSVYAQLWDCVTRAGIKVIT